MNNIRLLFGCIIFIGFSPAPIAKGNFDNRTYEKLLNLPICKIRDAKSFESKEINKIKNLISGNQEQLIAGMFLIEENALDSKVSCYIDVNLTSLYASALSRQKNYLEAQKLFYKASLYKGLDKKTRGKFLDLSLAASGKIIANMSTQASKINKDPLLSPQDISFDDEAIEDDFYSTPSSSSQENPETDTLLQKISSQQEQILSLEETVSSLQTKSNTSKKLTEQIKVLQRNNLNLKSTIFETNNSLDKLKGELKEGREPTFYEADLVIAQDRVLSLETQLTVLQTEMRLKNDQLQNLQDSQDRLISALSGGTRPELSSNTVKPSIDIFTIVILLIILFCAYAGYNFQLKNNNSQSEKKTVKKSSINTPNQLLIQSVENLLANLDLSDQSKDYLYGYCESFASSSQSNEIDSGFLMDELIQTVFRDDELISVKSRYRFLESKDLSQGKKEGSIDALSFTNEGGLQKLEKYLEL